LDFKSLKSRDLGSLRANLASAAIQCFEQPHRFAASSGLRSGEASAARTLFVIVNGNPWTFAAVAVDGRRSLCYREARIVRAEARRCKRGLAECRYRVI
jgi:hypothetical protein